MQRFLQESGPCKSRCKDQIVGVLKCIVGKYAGGTLPPQGTPLKQLGKVPNVS